MTDTSIVVARPDKPAHLVLLFHGVGSSAANLVPLAELVAQARPDAMVVSVDGPHPSNLGRGREWFSVAGVTEENRPQRVALALPLFRDTIAHWQRASGLGAGQTTLIGFSQGAIMALEATQAGDQLVARVVALAGRFAEPVRRVPSGVRFHFIHGAADPVILAQFSVEAAQKLRDLGADVTVDVLPDLGHGIDMRVANLLAGYFGRDRRTP
ncbi:esterase [Variovorax sp. YR216]|uniref:esterase n=1 Tax=Variovorax sp. YR216 TaxID=1882828 RepID=UPI00089790AA|nr:esterase [Variovorax sp. YR216]SEB19366.1 phospholipase/carboxylesterase [Variovorax sp. YR216]